jgi:hypothetical protein
VTHARINDHIISTEEDCKLAWIIRIWNLIEKDIIVGPLKVLVSDFVDK